jgi:hypothetical protein
VGDEFRSSSRKRAKREGTVAENERTNSLTKKMITEHDIVYHGCDEEINLSNYVYYHSFFIYVFLLGFYIFFTFYCFKT